jgi:hypothetical protein
MTQTTSGLTNGGVTNHYAFHYDDSLSAPINPGGPEPARTNAVIAACEADFNRDEGAALLRFDPVPFAAHTAVPRTQPAFDGRAAGSDHVSYVRPPRGSSTSVQPDMTSCCYAIASQFLGTEFNYCSSRADTGGTPT